MMGNLAFLAGSFPLYSNKGSIALVIDTLLQANIRIGITTFLRVCKFCVVVSGITLIIFWDFCISTIWFRSNRRFSLSLICCLNRTENRSIFLFKFKKESWSILLRLERVNFDSNIGGLCVKRMYVIIIQPKMQISPNTYSLSRLILPNCAETRAHLSNAVITKLISIDTLHSILIPVVKLSFRHGSLNLTDERMSQSRCNVADSDSNFYVFCSFL